MRNFSKVALILAITITTISCRKDDEVIKPEPIPVITFSSISPESGKKATAVIINGTNFGNDASKVKVFFNNTEAIVQSVSNTQIKTTAPENGSTGAVEIIVDSTSVIGPIFTYLNPNLSMFNPKTGPLGTEVTITGTAFGTDITKVQVLFDEIEAPIKTISDTEIKVDVPSEVPHVSNIIVIVDGTELTGEEFVLKAAISGIEPESGIKGTEVTINGSSFINVAGTGSIAVFINDKEAQITSALDDIIKFIVPVKAFSGNVKVVINDDEYIGPVFNYLVSEIEVSTIAGSGVPGFTNGTNTSATFKSPQGVSLDNLGNIYVADTENNSIRKISSDGEVTTLVGNGTNGDADGTGNEVQFSGINDVTSTASDYMFVTDKNNFKIKKVTTDGVVTTYAGTGSSGNNNGTALNATFGQTTGVVEDSQGNLYIVEHNKHRIRKITTSGVVSIFAGDGQAGTIDGNGTNAKFNFPYGIAIDVEDNLYVTDGGTYRIRKITPNGDVTTIAGSSAGFSDGQGAAAQFNFPTGIVVDKQGYIYVTDGSNNRIRKISPEGNVTTLAGDGSSSQFNQPQGITIDNLGDLYIADRSNHRILKITQE